MSEQRTESNPKTSSSSKRLSEIRIILIGGRELNGKGSGKSSTGNIILGRDAFTVGRRTARSVKAEGEVHGRHMTVVDTPGWWWHYCVENTPKYDIMEIMKSPTLCAPGPHAFLLVIPVNNIFPKVYRIGLEEHLEFFSKDIWRHIIVVFSCIALHDDESFKNYVRSWPDLQLLLRKCQNRFHVLKIKDTDDSSQVITLIEKIEKMVEQNNHNHFQITESVPVEDKGERINRRLLAVYRKRAELQARIQGGQQPLTNLQIVILGASWAGRSTAGNLILGKNVFEVDESRTTVCCEVKYAEVHGRELTVIDTPGWFWECPLDKTSKIDKLEIRHSVYLCPPGPHAILLTIPIATAFNKAYQIAVEEHMSLLGKEVWNHTIVLFTRGDWIGDTTIEERIKGGDEHLEWLMNQCGWRYHVFNSKNHTESTQVIELLQKIEEMVMENNGSHYKPDEKSNPSNELEPMMQKAEKDKKTRHRQKHMLQELLKERKKSLSEMRIVLLGAEGVGKSGSGNVIMQRYVFETTLEKGFKVQERTRQCLMEQRKVEGRLVSLVDTPAWSASHIEERKKEILRSVTICSPGPHAFLLVLPLNESFTKKSEQTVMELMRLFGERVWKHTLILFSGHWLKDRPVEQFINCEGEALQNLIRMCGNRYHVLNDRLNNTTQVRNLFKLIETLVARNRGEYYTQQTRENETTSVFQRLVGKVFTEEEWNKREDQLIERVMEALNVESSMSSARSFDGIVPSMSGDSFSDTASSTLNPAVCQWLLNPRNKASSSGYDTMSITSSSHYSKMDSIKDDSVPQNEPIYINIPNTPKYLRNMRERKHGRSSSI